MANASSYKSNCEAFAPTSDTVNEAGAIAYSLSPREALVQLAITGCLSNVYYADASEQIDQVLQLAAKIDPVFVAKAAIYARERGHMKDMPALLLASLATRDMALFSKAFPRVVDNGKMLRKVVQILRSGKVGRKSLGSRPKKLVQAWLCNASEKQLLNASVGNSPSLADVVKMVHPKPAEAWRAAWFAWLIGREFDETQLPETTRLYESYKRDRTGAVPAVPFQMLTALRLTKREWAGIAKSGSWQMVRQNLKAFARHGVFREAKAKKAIAAKLVNDQNIEKGRILPYQLMATFKSTRATVPPEIREALQEALELALKNVPELLGTVVVCPDVSDSMCAPVSGYRGSATTGMRCVDVAALIAAALLRKNPAAKLIPFNKEARHFSLNPNYPVLTNADMLAAICGGGTNCSAPLALLNAEGAKADLIILVSDNQSWIDNNRRGATQTLKEWELFRVRNPNARMVCIDVQPYASTQAVERTDILNIGGFSDEVFKIVGLFGAGTLGSVRWVELIEDLVI